MFELRGALKAITKQINFTNLLLQSSGCFFPITIFLVLHEFTNLKNKSRLSVLHKRFSYKNLHKLQPHKINET